MRVLLTGAKGQLGHALRGALTAHEVTALSRQDLDITGRDEVARAVDESRPEVILNAAAYTAVDAAESDPDGARAVNVDGVRNLALEAIRTDASIVHISTDYVFDGRARKPYVESDATNPMTVYGKTKLEGERVVANTCSRFHIVRTSWLYGPTGESFPKTMLRLAAEKERLAVVDDQRGSPTYAPHLALSIVALLESEDWGLWHLGGAGDATWFELTVKLFELADISTPVERTTTDCFPRPAPRPAYSVLGTERSAPRPLPPWQEGLARFVETL